MKFDQYNIIFIVGVLCGFGYVMVVMFFQYGWEVIGIVCDLLFYMLFYDLVKMYFLWLCLVMFDICDEVQLVVLQVMFFLVSFDMLFVNVGIINCDLLQIIGDVFIEEFYQVMFINVLVLMWVIECLQQVVKLQGLFGVMFFGQGSVINNFIGQWEFYCGSKVVLNMFMCSFVVCFFLVFYLLVVMVLGWICIEFGGVDVLLIIEEMILCLVNVLFDKW